MTRLYVNYAEYLVSGGEVCAGQEDDAWPCYETSYYDFSLESVTTKNVDPYHESFELEGDLPERVFVLFVRYSDGDTFGSSSGHGSIQGVFRTEEEAKEGKKAIEAGTWRTDEKFFTLHCPWLSYFANLESVEVVEMPVLR